MNKKRMMKRLLGGVALVLSMTMALGIFAGTGMDVKAATERDISTINVGDVLDNDDTIKHTIVSAQYSVGGHSYWDGNGYISIEYYDQNGNLKDTKEITGEAPEQGTKNLELNVTGCDSLRGVSKWEVTYVESGNSAKMYLKPYVEPTTPTTPTTPSAVSDEKGNSSSNDATHTHSYSWVTVQEANAGQDGIEEYKCACGDVQGRNVIPASEVAVKGLFGEIKNAPQNGTATFDSGRLYTISDYVIKKLAERTDVTTVITFEYQNQAYKMTIPAGADFTGLLADEDYFYGYFFFANAVGATIEAL